MEVDMSNVESAIVFFAPKAGTELSIKCLARGQPRRIGRVAGEPRRATEIVAALSFHLPNYRLLSKALGACPKLLRLSNDPDAIDLQYSTAMPASAIEEASSLEEKSTGYNCIQHEW